MNSGLYGFPGPHVWQSPLKEITNTAYTFSLPIQREPDLMFARMVCLIAEGEWQIGDVIDGDSIYTTDGAQNDQPAFALGYSRRGDGTRNGGLTLRILAFPSWWICKRYTIGFNLDTPVTKASWNVKAMAIWFDP